MIVQNPIIEFEHSIPGEVIITAVRKVVEKKNGELLEQENSPTTLCELVYEDTDAWHLGQRCHEREHDLIVRGGNVGDQPIYPGTSYKKIMVLHHVFGGIKREEPDQPKDVITILEDFRSRLIIELRFLGITGEID